MVDPQTFYPADFQKFPKGSERRGLLEDGNQFTQDSMGNIVDIWNYDTGDILERSVDGLIVVGFRSTPEEMKETEFSSERGYKTYLPAAVDDPNTPRFIKEYLSNGLEVTLDKDQNIVDIWNPLTLVTVNMRQEPIKGRNFSFLTSVGGFLTGTPFTVEELGFPADIIEWSEPLKSELPRVQITIDKDKNFVEMWNPDTNRILDINLIEIGWRFSPFNSKAEFHHKRGLSTFQKEKYPGVIRNETLILSLVNKGYHVTSQIVPGADSDIIVDVWDPVELKRLTVNEKVISSRSTPFPSGENLRKLRDAINQANAQIDEADLEWKFRQLVKVPSIYQSMGVNADGIHGSDITVLTTLRQEIFDTVGFFTAYYDQNLMVVDIQTNPTSVLLGRGKGTIYTIENNDINTITQGKTTNQGFWDRIDPNLLTEELENLVHEILEIEYHKQANTQLLKLLQRQKRRINIKQAIKETNR